MDFPTPDGHGKSEPLANMTSAADPALAPSTAKGNAALLALARAAGAMMNIGQALHGVSDTIAAQASMAEDLSEALNDARGVIAELLDAAAANATNLAVLRKAEAGTNRRLTETLAALKTSEADVKHWKALADTEARLRIEDAEKHKAEIAQLTAAPVALTPKGQAAVAAAPKTAAKPMAPAKAVVLDPDGHPVTNRKPATKKAR